MEEKLSYKSIVYQIRSLQFSGIFRLDHDVPRYYRSLHTIYMRGVLSLFTLYTFQQIMKMYEVQEDIDKVMGIMFLFLSNTDCIYKIISLWNKPKLMDEILDVMKGPIFNQDEPEHRTILMTTVRSGLLLNRILRSNALLACFLWVFYPTVFHLQGKCIDFPVWLPFDVNQNPLYYMAALYVWLLTSWLAFSNTTLDIFISFLLEQCRTQISIIRLDLSNIVENSKNEALATTSNYKVILERRFNKMLIHHAEIVNMADKIQDIFGGAVFYQFLVSGWILCTSAYRAVRVNPASIEFVSMIIYVMCILMEVCLYCHYGNKLTYESEKLMESAYAVDWLEMPIEQRRSLMIFIERNKRPIQPTAGSIIPLSNATFISILRSSFSFYTFLKNSKGQH